ncbi:MAG: hypothetical protein ACTSV2_06845 [Candidatus Thorarchaeota archaeon]
MHDYIYCPYCNRCIVPIHTEIPEEPVRFRCGNCKRIVEYIYGFGAFAVPLGEQDADGTTDPLEKGDALFLVRRMVMLYSLGVILFFIAFWIAISIAMQVYLLVLNLVLDNIFIVAIIGVIGLLTYTFYSIAKGLAKFVRKAQARITEWRNTSEEL